MEDCGRVPAGMCLRPIGIVRNGYLEKPDRPWEEIESAIEVDPSLQEALDGIEGFSHVIVLFWLDRVEDDERGRVLKQHPQRQEHLPQVGIFAIRTMSRPNPIGLTSVRLLERKGSTLRVMGLDALDGTPVVDLKPYLPRGDCWPDATVPWWIQQLWAEQDANHQ